MDDLLLLLNPKISFGYILFTFIVFCIVIIIRLFFFKAQGVKRFIVFSLLVEYYFLVLCSTVICRTASIHATHHFAPFWNYKDLWQCTDFPKDHLEVLLNIALFVPIGFLASLSISRVKSYQIFGIGVLLSAIIELLQLIFQRGLCETDDVIHNTFGAMIGFAIYRIMFPYYRKLK